MRMAGKTLDNFLVTGQASAKSLRSFAIRFRRRQFQKLYDSSAHRLIRNDLRFSINNVYLKYFSVKRTNDSDAKGRLPEAFDLYQAENDKPGKSASVLLVNGKSASATEILAGVLQDHDRALVVGENTFGKGLVQKPFMLEYGSMLLLTFSKYETPAGRFIQRGYSNNNLYDYQTKGGLLQQDGGTYVQSKN